MAQATAARNPLSIYARSTTIKRAAHDGSDTVPFEQAMANLAITSLQDRAPQLMDNLLGVQLLEKNPENTKAVAVMGFSIGKDMYLAPLFFLNGRLKGQELLFSKSQNVFLPLTESWITYLKNKSSQQPTGRSVPKQTRLMGVEYPVLSAYSEVPGKYASDMSSWAQEGVPGLAYAATHYKSPQALVPELVKVSADAAYRLLKLVDMYPQTARPIIECYGPELLKTAMETCKSANSILSPAFRTKSAKVTTGSIYSKPETNPEKLGQLRIYTYDGQPKPGLNEKQAIDLKRDGFIVHDTRPEHSRLYASKQNMKLQTPTESGIYDLLTHPDTYDRCVILMDTISNHGYTPDALVIRANDSSKRRAFVKAAPATLWVSDPKDEHDLKKWIEKLPEVKELEKGAEYILIAPNGKATCVFEARESLPSAEGEKTYRVYWRNYCDYDRPCAMGKITSTHDDCSYHRDPLVVIGRPQSTEIATLAGTVYVPDGTKVIKLREPSEWDKKENKKNDDRESPIRPGNLLDIQLCYYKNACELKLYADDCEVVVNDRRMSKQAGLFHLIREHGLTEKTARDAIADARRQAGARYRIKYANPYHELQHTAPSAPSIPDFPQNGTDDFFQSGLPTNHPVSYDQPVSGLQTLRPGMMNMAAPADPQVMQGVMQAAQTGQKEVLDTSLLNGLLKGTQDETVIDRFMGPLVKGLDALGRLYFNFLWHHDLFEDRYGGEKMPEMEDALRNVFNSMGDLILELKQEGPETYLGDGLQPSLEQMAEV